MLIANIYKKLKKYLESINTLNKLIVIEKDNQNAYLMLAGLYDNIKDYYSVVNTIDILLGLKLDGGLKQKTILDS